MALRFINKRLACPIQFQEIKKLIFGMGRHADWRRIAKRERRRKIRKATAQQRDIVYDDEEYWKELELLEQMEIEKVELINNEENEKWLKAEKLAIAHWNKLQEHMKMMQKEKLEQEAKLQMEWEMEQERLKKEAERLEAIEEENRKKHEIFMRNLEEFLSGNSTEPPEELLVYKETRPGVESCPFFAKTACCRFGDQCSRNHKYPGISRTLLATNFYTHFGLNNSTQNEYDTDIMLEYEDGETYKDFKEFFYDVLTEFEKFGKIVQFKVCNNYEKHLRGNVYVEYGGVVAAVTAYRALHSRWYAGRQLSLHFCTITSWKNAICGLQLKKRCPKGRACNFLHVFRNPNNLFSRYDNYQSDNHDSERSRKTPPRSWRWSESPEVEIPNKSTRRESRSPKNREKDKRRHYEKKHRSRTRSRRDSRD